ncbi:hypothetical protein BU23DRAFT_586619 [Bimuria novae-zelandiae CBS 107.79]|uniref:DUF7918 domain-containing protein n=1 Tax=Bimuria novae-zelandiae CBS 107.79 TaxID=1447943 RepID=A0A6A5VS64_9PLEO|nr:hypothetical protein BU23DRAFT_586619 [Bimuria novae-zelandiae CBS 107.79]
MPNYRSISIKLHSQFDIETYPEFLPRPHSHYVSRGIPTPATVPVFEDSQTSTCSVYVPVYANSQFWLSYDISPPVPDDQHFLFKLYINGAHVVSWSTGKEDKWKGKTMFALFEMEDDDGRKRVEKRVMCFTAPKDGRWGDVENVWDEKARLEIRVHRALGRKRAERVVEEYGTTEHGKCEKGISLMSAGRAGSEQPKRFYKFALIDPADKPYATFRYFYRTWAQLRELGLSEYETDVVEDGESNQLSVIEPDDRGVSQRSESCYSQDVAQEGSYHPFHDGADDCPCSPREAYISTGSPKKRTSGFRRRLDDHERTRRIGRLSVPPSCKLDPPKHPSRHMPTIPQKHDAAAAHNTSYQPHPIYPLNDWEMRTPSPVQSMRETISTPTLVRRTKRGFTPTGWLNAIGNAWRRRATPSNLSSDDGSRATSRGDSRGVR